MSKGSAWIRLAEARYAAESLHLRPLSPFSHLDAILLVSE
jgi:hypothetical protein